MNSFKASTRILFVHPDVYAFGGAEQVCVRMMAAAQRVGQVTLVHCGGPLDCERIWNWFQITLDPARVRFITAGSMGAILGHARRKPIMKYALALRYARKLVSEFDLVVGSYGECPIPAHRGIQYINIPIFSAAPQFLRYLNVKPDALQQVLLRPFYIRVSRWLCGWDLKEIVQKRTLVNSVWTSGIVRQVYGVSSSVANPDIEVKLRPGGQDWVNWTDREMAFVMLGRFHPSKRLELGIEVIQRIRSQGHDVQLHLVGRGADRYVKQLERSIAGMSSVHLHLDLPRSEMEKLIVTKKFGLHACEFEHFGIAAAEMQALGCVVFAPDFAGQREVVIDPDQRYVDVDDAVKKISKFLNDFDLCRRRSVEAVQRLNCGATHCFEEQVGAIFEKALVC